ncbi:MAG: helix-turn-helix transcriptional regulator [Isosphaeraceae bacterium]|nr:helix-turn-helix transcriptional regulator [Isosphaeraceae bacterium]
MRLHELLKQLVDDRGISVRELARRLGGASPTTVGKWLTREGDPRLSELRALAEFFDVPLAHLLGQEEPAPASLAEDERMVLELYRSLKPEIDHRDALRALALTRASVTATTVPDEAALSRPHAHGPAKFLARQDLTESDAQRRRGSRRGKPKRGR